jgi:hypothetical protein
MIMAGHGTRDPSAVHVPVGQAHRWTNIVEDLTVLVVFSPPSSGRGT